MQTANDIPFNFAFQPIIDCENETVFSYEALIRGTHNEPAASIFSQVKEENKYAFDQAARNQAISIAADLNVKCLLNLNFLPECLESTDHFILETLMSMDKAGFSPRQLVIELTEASIIHDPKKFISHIHRFRTKGIKFAIDDFGAGYSGLNLLVNFQPDMIKLDMELIRDIYKHGPRQSIVKALIQICISLGISLVAEGVESHLEYVWLKQHGISLFQGFLFAKPGFMHLPEVFFPPLS